MARRGYRGVVSANIHATRFTKYFSIADNQTRSASPTDTSITVSPATAIRRRLPPVRPMTFAGPLAAAARDDAIRALEKTDDTNHRRRVDGMAIGLVVEADVAARNRHVERSTRLANPFDRLCELPHDRRAFRVAEVQAIGRAERPGAGARDVPGRFSHGEHRAPMRIEVAVPAVPIDRQSQRAIGAAHTNDARAHSWQIDRARPHHVVVLAVHPALAADRRRTEQCQKIAARLKASRYTPGAM